MSNYVLRRPDYVGYFATHASGYAYASGMSASAITDSNDLGSVREIAFEVTSDTAEATSSLFNDAVVATAISGVKGTLTFTLEEITSSAQKLMWGAAASASGGEFFFTGSAASMSGTYAMVAEPFYIDGSAYTAVFTKCTMVPGSGRKLSKDQELFEVKMNVLVDTDASANKEFIRFIQQ